MPRPEKFRESLQKFNIEPSVVSMIFNGYEDITNRTPKKQRAAFFARSMQTLDEKLDFKLKSLLLEDNACCLGGTVGKVWAERAEKMRGLPLSERIKGCNQSDDFCKAILNSDESLTITINNWNGESFYCSCTQFTKLKDIPEVSSTYCLCCAGNLKYH